MGKLLSIFRFIKVWYSRICDFIVAVKLESRNQEIKTARQKAEDGDASEYERILSRK